jgi:glycosyltransferase involved in cell wall biosynthesis
VHFGGDALMGQHEYERQLIGRLTASDAIRAVPFPVRAMRAEHAGRRLPLGLIERRPLRVQRWIASAVYRGVDLVHRLDARLPPARDEILTLHDIAPLIYDDEGTWPRTATASARAARLVLAPSQFAADEISARLGVERVLAIPNGVDKACFTAGPLTDDDRKALGAPLGRFILCAGGASRRKNLVELAACWRELARLEGDVELVLCGAGQAKKMELFGGLERCRVLGHLERGLLLRLMTSAEIVVTPSLYEGFGLPVVEAMAAGTTVVSSRTSALGEIAGDVAIVVEPTAQGLLRGLAGALADEQERRTAAGLRHAATFDWDVTAQRHVEVYEKELGPSRHV